MNKSKWFVFSTLAVASGDGIPDRHDRVYNPRWDVDGDGIPSRHGRDRDGDGTPNRHDRHDGRTWRR